LQAQRAGRAGLPARVNLPQYRGSNNEAAAAERAVMAQLRRAAE